MLSVRLKGCRVGASEVAAIRYSLPAVDGMRVEVGIDASVGIAVGLATALAVIVAVGKTVATADGESGGIGVAGGAVGVAQATSPRHTNNIARNIRLRSNLLLLWWLRMRDSELVFTQLAA